MIFVMEDAHGERLFELYREHLLGKPVHVLDIPDEFGLMDPELVSTLRAGVEPYLSDRR